MKQCGVEGLSVSVAQDKGPYHVFTSSTLCNNFECKGIIGLFQNHTRIETLLCGRVNAHTQIAGLKGTPEERHN